MNFLNHFFYIGVPSHYFFNHFFVSGFFVFISEVSTLDHPTYAGGTIVSFNIYIFQTVTPPTTHTTATTTTDVTQKSRSTQTTSMTTTSTIGTSPRTTTDGTTPVTKGTYYSVTDERHGHSHICTDVYDTVYLRYLFFKFQSRMKNGTRNGIKQSFEFMVTTHHIKKHHRRMVNSPPSKRRMVYSLPFMTWIPPLTIPHKNPNQVKLRVTFTFDAVFPLNVSTFDADRNFDFYNMMTRCLITFFCQ